MTRLSVVFGTLISVAAVDAARFERNVTGTPGSECCACPAAGGNGTTVTVTHTAPAQTVYVTQVPQVQTVVQHVTVSPVAEDNSPSTVYVNSFGGEEPSPEAEEPQTVTVQASRPKTVTVQGARRPAAQIQQQVTVTATPESAPQVVTRTLQPQNPSEPQTVVISASPSEETPQVVTVTASGPGGEAAASDQYITVTQTVNGGGGDITNINNNNNSNQVQITIINQNTGEASCHVEGSDEPCSSASPGTVYVSPSSSTTSCPSTSLATSMSTVYNTVIVTAPSAGMSMSPNATMSTSSPSSKRAPRVPRAPLRQWPDAS